MLGEFRCVLMNTACFHPRIEKINPIKRATAGEIKGKKESGDYNVVEQIALIDLTIPIPILF
jgi:hypothetical protein